MGPHWPLEEGGDGAPQMDRCDARARSHKALLSGVLSAHGCLTSHLSFPQGLLPESTIVHCLFVCFITCAF